MSDSAYSPCATSKFSYLSKVLSGQSNLLSNADAPSAKFPKHRVILNQRKERLASIEKPATKVVERCGITKDLFSYPAEVCVDGSLKLIADGFGGFSVDTKYQRLLTSS